MYHLVEGMCSSCDVDVVSVNVFKYSLTQKRLEIEDTLSNVLPYILPLLPYGKDI